MIGAKLHGLRPASSAPGLSLALRRRGPSSLVSVRQALPVARRAVVVASAKKFRGRHPPLPRLDRILREAAEEAEYDDSGPALIPAPSDLPSESLPDGRDSSSRARKLGPPAGETSPKKQPLLVGGKEEPVTGAPLRGRDVLLALQRAAAQKKSRRGKARHAGTKNGGRPEQGGDDGEVEARPLEIKEDWVPRLEELEKAVEEIQQQQLGDSM